MTRRLAVALVAALLSALSAVPGTAAAVAGDPPTLGTPTFTATSAATVAVSVSVDTQQAATTVQVEYVTAGAYRQRVPGPATTVTIASLPASASGPSVVTGEVTGLDPGSAYRMRVKAVNAGGETVSADTVLSTPRSPKVTFKAKVGKDATTLTKLAVSGLVGAGPETVKVKCKTVAKGCPFASETATVTGTKLSWKSSFKGHALRPGAKVTVQVVAGGSRVSTLTLTIRDDQQPKVKRK